MAEKLQRLTPEQEALIPKIRDKWIKIGLSCGPVDRPAVEAAAKLAYECAGLKPPSTFVWLDSPLQAVIHSFKLSQKEDEGDIQDQVWSHIGKCNFGSQDAAWLSFYDFFREAGLNVSDKMDGLFALAQGGWWVAFEDLCILTEKPVHIKMDDENRLHCEDGPAILYPDGFSVSAWHAVRIPGEWLTDKPPTAEQALTWENVEQRRAACEILGWEVVLRELDSVTIDKNPNPYIGELVEVDLPDIGKEKFLRYLCGTNRWFAEPVPPEMETAFQANGNGYSYSKDEFIIPEIRT